MIFFKVPYWLFTYKDNNFGEYVRNYEQMGTSVSNLFIFFTDTETSTILMRWTRTPRTQTTCRGMWSLLPLAGVGGQGGPLEAGEGVRQEKGVFGLDPQI